jgi:hypothetical protein
MPKDERPDTRSRAVADRRIALKKPTGWFAAGREVARAMSLLSDGAFKLYVHVCLSADRSTGRLKVDHGELAAALRKSRRSIVKYVEEVRQCGICTTRQAVNQHADGEIEICDGFWPYVKSIGTEESGENVVSYVEIVRQLLAARTCVNKVFNPADEHLARQMFRDHVELKQIEQGVLLGCARRYVALLKGTAVGPIAGLRYFSSTIQEVQALQTSEDYWRHLAVRVAKFEQQWVPAKQP